MRSRLKAALAALLISLTVGAMTAAPAAAITGGTPDGEPHPNVGLILFYTPDGRFRCSATLVTPTVLLTAAHCTAGKLGKTLVDFRFGRGGEPPTGYPVATNPTAGYTQAEIEAAGFLSGTAYTHPAYSDFTDLDNWNDVGVVVLDRPVTDIAPATLAPLDYLDAYAQPTLNKTLFTVGRLRHRGAQARAGPQKPTPMTLPADPPLRRHAGPEAHRRRSCRLNGNVNDTRGTGGTCFGDSGGPAFLDGYVVDRHELRLHRPTAATSAATSGSTSRSSRTGWPPSESSPRPDHAFLPLFTQGPRPLGRSGALR